MKKINNRTMKENNVRILLNTIRKKGPISRAELAKELDLTSPTITSQTSELLEKHLSSEIGRIENHPTGRKPIMLSINPTACYVMGLVMTNAFITVVLGDFAGEIHQQRKTAIDPALGRDRILSRMIEELQSMRDGSGIPREQILALGVSAPGPLDSENGILTAPPNFPDWRSVPICQILERALGIPAVLDKESNAAALAEYYASDESDVPTFYILILRNSIGGCPMESSRILRGFKDYSGDIGHMLVDINGPQCTCGQFGCLECLASGNALVRRTQAELKALRNRNCAVEYDIETLTIEDIVENARKGIPLFENVLEYAAQMMALAIGNIITILCPGRFILGGPFLDIYPEFLDRVAEQVHKRRYPYCVDEIRIERSRLGSEWYTKGAIMLALDCCQKRLCGEWRISENGG